MGSMRLPLKETLLEPGMSSDKALDNPAEM